MSKMMEKMKELSLEKERKAVVENINRLKKALEQKRDGDDKALDVALDDATARLDEILAEYNESNPQEKGQAIERLSLPRTGEVLSTGDKVVLSVIREEEKEKYVAISYEYSYYKRWFEREEFVTALWEDFLSETAFVCSVYKIDTGEYLGYCSIKDITRADLEVAIELLPEYCHMGYGTEALSLLLDNVYRLTGRRYYRARVAIDNFESQGLMKKLGAVPNGVSEFLLHGDAIEEFKEENRNEITDKIRAVAKEFGMEAEDILGYVLEYRFDMEKKCSLG